MDRNDLLKERRQKEKQDRVPMVLTFTKQLPDVRRIVQKHLKILHQSDRMKTVFTAPPLLAFKRDRNIGDLLVHGKYNKVMRQAGQEASECECEVCTKMMNATRIKTQDGKEHPIKTHFGCKTKNVIYGLSCKRCDQNCICRRNRTYSKGKI